MDRYAFLTLLAGALGTGMVLLPASAQNGRDVDAACVMPVAPGSQTATYRVQLEMRGDDSRALGSGVVNVSHLDGTGMTTVDCSKPRVLMRLAPGSYIATVDAPAGPTKTLKFRVRPSQGTRTLILRFPPGVPELTDR